MVHWVSLITPNFQGSAEVNETPINIVNAKANAITVLKQNILFICRFIRITSFKNFESAFVVVCQNSYRFLQRQLQVM
jgi:hypothetical protein